MPVNGTVHCVPYLSVYLKVLNYLLQKITNIRDTIHVIQIKCSSKKTVAKIMATLVAEDNIRPITNF